MNVPVRIGFIREKRPNRATGCRRVSVCWPVRWAAFRKKTGKFLVRKLWNQQRTAAVTPACLHFLRCLWAQPGRCGGTDDAVHGVPTFAWDLLSVWEPFDTHRIRWPGLKEIHVRLRRANPILEANARAYVCCSHVPLGRPPTWTGAPTGVL